MVHPPQQGRSGEWGRLVPPHGRTKYKLSWDGRDKKRTSTSDWGGLIIAHAHVVGCAKIYINTPSQFPLIMQGCSSQAINRASRRLKHVKSPISSTCPPAA